MRKPNYESLAVGLNPAWQKTLFFEQFSKNQVNRAVSMQMIASGKGINTVQACRSLGGKPLLLQFTGGTPGQSLLQDLEQRGIDHLSIPIIAATRTCTTLLDQADGSMTELIEPSPVIQHKELMELQGRLPELLLDCRTLALCGTLPQKVSSLLYRDIVKEAAARTWIIVDAYRDLEPVLAAGPHFLKINRHELQSLTGTSDPKRAAHLLFKQYNLFWLAVTDGGREALLFSRHRQWRYQLPRLENVISPLGAGDTATGALLGHMAEMLGPRENFKATDKNYRSASEKLADGFHFALAAASASCLTSQPAVIDRNNLDRIKPLIQPQIVDD